MDYFNTEGHLNDEGIALYADAIKFNKVQLLPDGFKKHLESCTICQHQVVDFTSIMVEVKQEVGELHPYFNKQKELASTVSKTGNVRPIIYRIAVAAIFGLLVFFAYQQFNEPKSDEIVNVNQEDNIEKQKEEEKELINPTPKEELVIEKQNDNKKQRIPASEKPEIKQIIEKNNRELFAANFIPNDEFESILGTTTRSENFKVDTPTDGSLFKLKQPIAFKWENNIKLNLTILDNQEEEVFVKAIEGTIFDFENNLSPGIYYWKLETKEDLLHLGKFTVE